MYGAALSKILHFSMICRAIIFLLQFITASKSKEYEFVTCKSVIKLQHQVTGARLHSHEIPYGTGSGQQSVTGNLSPGDPNSLFIVGPANDKNCARGDPIPCGSVITLTHSATKTKLHSHEYRSPLSRNQEVSSSTANDANDNFILACSTTSWKRGEPVTLRI